MNATTLASLLLLAAIARGPATAQEPAPWRAIPALESFAVTHCLGDRSLTWVTRSKSEQRALFTPELYGKCPSGTAVYQVFPCCATDQSHAAFRSRRELEQHFDTLLGDPAVAGNLPAGRAWVDAYLKTVDRAVDFSRETLVLTAIPYGATGMATASLSFEEKDGLLTARVTIRVPPPPLTPDTALFRFAFAVSRDRIERVEIVTSFPGVSDLGVAPSSTHVASFPI